MDVYRRFGSYGKAPDFAHCVAVFREMPKLVVCHPTVEKDLRTVIEAVCKEIGAIVPTITTNGGCLVWEIWFLIN